MASPGELVQVTAHSLGIEEGTVASHYRALREAGLVTKAGRGPSAPAMTPADAAALLISVASGGLAKDGVHTIERYGALSPTLQTWNSHTDDEPDRGQAPIGAGGWAPKVLRLPRLVALGRDHSFRDALTALIASVVDGTLVHRSFGGRSRHAVIIRLSSPVPEVVISANVRGINETLSYSDREAHASDGDFRTYRSFTSVTLTAIGQLLQPNGS
jgi:DNA-binding transcriptional ArsR family regulator